MKKQLNVIAMTDGVVPKPVLTSTASVEEKRITYTNTIKKRHNESLKRAAYWRRDTERTLLDEIFEAWLATQNPENLRPIPPKKK